jgi:hypothetical protein
MWSGRHPEHRRRGDRWLHTQPTRLQHVLRWTRAERLGLGAWWGMLTEELTSGMITNKTNTTCDFMGCKCWYFLGYHQHGEFYINIWMNLIMTHVWHQWKDGECLGESSPNGGMKAAKNACLPRIGHAFEGSFCWEDGWRWGWIQTIRFAHGSIQ